ncbi:MAG: hypothetical protein OEY25_11105 [Candidatus Aminicenantes bacterium]|nr:hypothetical protein [Candidatus Aminicenantes bacterium]MDH5705936.1 hypothetical protein [Candidatus Aminicenantes bacterium]
MPKGKNIKESVVNRFTYVTKMNIVLFSKGISSGGKKSIETGIGYEYIGREDIFAACV